MVGEMRCWLAIGALVMLTGCPAIYEEVLNPPTTAGGAVAVSVDGSDPKTTSALATAKAEPLTIEGQSANVTFFLTAADETSGSTALARLMVVDSSVDLLISPTGRSKIEVHMNGSGCVSDGKSGHIHLQSGDNGKLSGDYELSGTVANSTTACVLSGTLDSIPVTKK